MRPALVDQRRYPLATLVLCAGERGPLQRVRLLALASHESASRRAERGIPTIDE